MYTLIACISICVPLKFPFGKSSSCKFLWKMKLSVRCKNGETAFRHPLLTALQIARAVFSSNGKICGGLWGCANTARITDLGRLLRSQSPSARLPSLTKVCLARQVLQICSELTKACSEDYHLAPPSRPLSPNPTDSSHSPSRPTDLFAVHSLADATSCTACCDIHGSGSQARPVRFQAHAPRRRDRGTQQLASSHHR